MTVTVGEQVSDFTVETTDGTRSLSSFQGSKLVLYFYPKDNTPGCTNEAAEFRDQYTRFRRLKVAIVGVSRDSLKSHERFREKLELPFPLAADVDEALCTQFDVIKMKSMYGKKVRGIERSTFLIDESGQLTREWRGVKVAGHVDEVLQACR